MRAIPIFLLAGAVVAVACREDRSADRQLPGAISESRAVRQSELQPGAVLPSVQRISPYRGNARAVEEGKRYYNWYNCSGCHFAGGGGIGPPLMDEEWIYGSEPENLLDTILEGRPDGMPSYRGKLPLDHAWKIIAYIESLGGVPEPGPVQPPEVQGTERSPGQREHGGESHRGGEGEGSGSGGNSEGSS